MIEENDSDDEPPIAHFFGEKPDHREWPPLGELALLDNAICYAINLHLDSKERPASETAKEDTHKAICEHAISDILEGRLNGRFDNGKYRVQVLDFYRWIKQYYYADICPEFSAKDPSLNKESVRSREDQDIDETMSSNSTSNRNELIQERMNSLAAEYITKCKPWTKSKLAFDISKTGEFSNLSAHRIERVTTKPKI